MSTSVLDGPVRRRPGVLVACVLAVGLTSCASAAPDPAPSAAPSPVPRDGAFSTAPGRPLPGTLYGVTAESVADLPALSGALAAHSRHPTVRLVFQQGEPPDAYAPAVTELRRHSYLMGELLDSTALSTTSTDAYRARTRAYVSRFGNRLDIYEIGNELNGAWAGTPADLNAKVQAAYDVVEKEHAALGLRSAVTLNYWPSGDCHSEPWEDTGSFAAQMPAEVRTGVDYVFLSFYETACDPRAHPTDAEFTDALTELAALFPNARVGIGEIGAQGTADGLPADPGPAEKERVATRYYGLHPAAEQALGERYVGGYFWWYYSRDAVPADRPDSLWPTLDRLFAGY